MKASELLRSAASAADHGRNRTMQRKLTQALFILIPQFAELMDLLNQDIYTDAAEYRDRIGRIGEIMEFIFRNWQGE